MLVSATYIDVVCGVIAAACGVLMIVGFCVVVWVVVGFMFGANFVWLVIAVVLFSLNVLCVLGFVFVAV